MKRVGVVLVIVAVLAAAAWLATMTQIGGAPRSGDPAHGAVVSPAAIATGRTANELKKPNPATDAAADTALLRGHVMDDGLRALGGAKIALLDPATHAGDGPVVVANLETGSEGQFVFSARVGQPGNALRISSPGMRTTVVWVRDLSEPVEVALDRSARLDIDVRVIGSARAGVRLTARPVVAAQTESAMLAVRGSTDSGGHVELRGLGAGPIAVELEMESLRLVTRRVFLAPGRDTRLAIDLPRLVAVRGRIVSKDELAPVAGAEVEVSDGTRCVSGASGEFELRVPLGPRQGLLGIVSIDGVEVGRLRLPRSDDTGGEIAVGDVAVESLRTLRGDVLLAGRPCENAQVFLTTKGRGRPETFRTRTNAAGAFVVRCRRGVPLADLAASTADGLSCGVRPLAVRAQDETVVDLGSIVLHRSRELVVRAEYRATGQVVPFAKFVLLGPFAADAGELHPGKDFDPAAHCIRSRTGDSEGEARIFVPEGLQTILEVAADGHRRQHVRLTGGDGQDVIVVKLEPEDADEVVVRGRVTDTAGWGARAMVECVNARGTALNCTPTDWAGLFELRCKRGLAKSLVARSLSRPDAVAATVDLTSSETQWLEVTASW